jgi:hypothetical protein
MSISLGTFAFRNVCHRLAILWLLLAPLMVQALPIAEDASSKRETKTGGALDMIEVVLVVVAASLALAGLFASAYFSCRSSFLS